MDLRRVVVFVEVLLFVVEEIIYVYFGSERFVVNKFVLIFVVLSAEYIFLYLVLDGNVDGKIMKVLLVFEIE